MLENLIFRKRGKFRFTKLLKAFFSSFLAIYALISLLILITSCQTTENSSTKWQIYRNSRYNFEFPYPDNWIASPPPDNGDGQAFSAPQNPTVNIRGWAESRLPLLERKAQKQQSLNNNQHFQQNFTTQQGLKGELQVQIKSDINSMTLNLVQDNVQYHWQGQAPSQQFADYYRFFYYVASEFRVQK